MPKDNDYSAALATLIAQVSSLRELFDQRFTSIEKTMTMTFDENMSRFKDMSAQMAKKADMHAVEDLESIVAEMKRESKERDNTMHEEVNQIKSWMLKLMGAFSAVSLLFFLLKDKILERF